MRKRLDGLMRELADLEEIVLLGYETSAEDDSEPEIEPLEGFVGSDIDERQLSFYPVVDSASETKPSEPEDSLLCLSSSSCVLVQSLSTLLLLCSLLALTYSEWWLHTSAQLIAVISVSCSASISLLFLSILRGSDYTGAVLWAECGLLTGYIGYYAALWGKAGGEVMWLEAKRLWQDFATFQEPQRPVSPTSFSEPQATDSEEEESNP